MNDFRLVKKILKGDSAAGERLVTAHYSRIYRMLRCLTGSVETAEDLTQQTFTQVWQALPKYQGLASTATWLHQIAYHEYTHWLRGRKDHLSLEDASDVADVRAAVGLDSIVISLALLHLPNEQRDTFVLYYIQQLSVAEVAAVLELPVGTIKSRLFTARRQMRSLWQAAEAPITSRVEENPSLQVSRVEGGQTL